MALTPTAPGGATAGVSGVCDPTTEKTSGGAAGAPTAWTTSMNGTPLPPRA
jgi:hypothetical protein